MPRLVVFLPRKGQCWSAPKAPLWATSTAQFPTMRGQLLLPPLNDGDHRNSPESIIEFPTPGCVVESS